MTKANIFKNATTNKSNLILVLLTFLLITIPLKPIFGSIAVILFVLVSFSGFYKLQFRLNKALLLPIGLYLLMVISLIWSTNIDFTIKGLQKEASLLVLPLAFLFLPKLEKKEVYKIFRWFGFGMVVFAIYSFARASYRFYETGNQDVFLFNDLVSIKLNAIYIAAFASFCLFYFVALKTKKPSISLLFIF